MGVEHQRMKIDYSIVRYPWDKLDNEILHYSEMDVVGLSEGIKKIMKSMAIIYIQCRILQRDTFAD